MDAENSQSSFDTVADAVAELDRREAEENADESDTDPALEAEGDEADAEEAATDEEDEAPEADDTPPAKIKFAGQEYEVPAGTPRAIAEAVEQLGGRLEADYTRKTQEVAQVRQHAEQASTAYMQAFQQTQEFSQALATMGRQIIGEEPDLSLAQQDPAQYVAMKAFHDQRVAYFNQLVQSSQQQQQQNQQMQQAAYGQYLQSQFQALSQVAPELNSPAKFNEFKQAAMDAGAEFGFSPEEVGSLDDHRTLMFIKKYTEMKQELAKYQNGKAQLKEKLSNVPPKVAKPGNTSPDGGKSARKEDAKRQFAKSGRTMRDVERYLRSTG